MAVEVCVKGATGNSDVLGDCPFCQKVLLTLEEKNVEYKLHLVNLEDKPQWFLDISPKKTVPLVKFNQEWVADSDCIVKMLEERYPEPSLTPPSEVASVGSNLFSSFVGFLKSKDVDGEAKNDMINELKELDHHLKTHSPFIAGEEISAVDLNLAPKLYHVHLALGHFKKMSIPEEFAHVHKYMKAMFARDSFVRTKAEALHVIAGWKAKLHP